MMVTLGVISMCGIMGLAVDLGWSYFVEKQAQAAADMAALGAVQEAHANRGVGAGFTCSVAPSGNTQAYCQWPTPANCSTLNVDSNLWNGCLYAKENGFIDGGLNGAQQVRMQAYCGPAASGALGSCIAPPTAPNINDIAYWATARATQAVPQLFSSVLGNTSGIVSASATAAIVSSVLPGSFYALNQEGDCIGTGNGFTVDCGVDVHVKGAASAVCSGSGGVSAAICAANGIVLSSTCHGASQTGCNSNGNSFNYAGETTGSGGSNGNGSTSKVWASQAQVRSSGANTGSVDEPSKWSPVPAGTTDPLTTSDPFKGMAQPPLQTPNSPIGTCGVLVDNQGNATIDGGNGSPLQLGPYQYYAVNSSNVPTGGQIVLKGNIQFSSSAVSTGVCNTGAPSGATQNGSFPVYMFYGGLQATSTGSTTSFGAGQYVMVGTSTVGGDALSLAGGNMTVTGDQGAGTQFITTNLGYPGLSTQSSALPAALTNGSIRLYQGSIDIKTGNNASVQLDGLDKGNGNLPSSLAPYNGSLFWQDRRNSTLISDALGNITSAPCNQAQGGSLCNTVPNSLDANGVTSLSPQFIYNASTQLALSGALYQARGAWFNMQASVDISSGLQIITGMITSNGSGAVNLLPNPLPIIQYRVALIK